MLIDISGIFNFFTRLCLNNFLRPGYCSKKILFNLNVEFSQLTEQFKLSAVTKIKYCDTCSPKTEATTWQRKTHLIFYILQQTGFKILWLKQLHYIRKQLSSSSSCKMFNSEFLNKLFHQYKLPYVFHFEVTIIGKSLLALRCDGVDNLYKINK